MNDNARPPAFQSRGLPPPPSPPPLLSRAAVNTPMGVREEAAASDVRIARVPSALRLLSVRPCDFERRARLRFSDDT